MKIFKLIATAGLAAFLLLARIAFALVAATSSQKERRNLRQMLPPRPPFRRKRISKTIRPCVRPWKCSAKEPRDDVESILLLIDLGHPELAKPILADLIKLNVTDEQRVAIVNEFGTEGMLKLSQAKELGADAATFATACMAAAMLPRTIRSEFPA